jgi:hypothetical protein
MKLNGKDVVFGDKVYCEFKDPKTNKVLLRIDDLYNASNEEKLLVTESLKHSILSKCVIENN